MAAPPVQPPTDNEVATIATLFEWLRDWGWSVIGPVTLGATWWLSSLYSKVQGILTRHDAEIESLKEGREATNKQIADMPTRNEFHQFRMEIAGRFDRLDEQQVKLLSQLRRDD